MNLRRKYESIFSQVKRLRQQREYLTAKKRSSQLQKKNLPVQTKKKTTATEGPKNYI